MTGRVVAGGLCLLLAGGLQACCFRGADASAEDAEAAASAAPSDHLDIDDWGPQRTRAGVAFNVQPGGRAAIWVRVDRPLDGRVAQVRFDDAVLEGHASGNLVTVMVPDALYAKPGVYPVQVLVRDGNGRWNSNEVRFTVE